jgi:glycine cleavage system H protein
MPLSGTVEELNPRIESEPELVNKDPYGEGWMVKIKIEDPSEVDSLLSAADYRSVIGQ